MIKFGTGGWRAVIGDDFTRENISKVAQAISDILAQDGKTDKPIMIGFDRRFLSEAGARWMCEVFAANGIKVLRMNRSAPSPLVMHFVMKQALHCGIEVTASHNPPEYDGCKVYFKDGSFVSCRFSGTEPLLRFMAEADTEDLASSYMTAFESFVSEDILGGNV